MIRTEDQGRRSGQKIRGDDQGRRRLVGQTDRSQADKMRSCCRCCEFLSSQLQGRDAALSHQTEKLGDVCLSVRQKKKNPLTVKSLIGGNSELQVFQLFL